jgi:NADPH-dependent 2,4-dienoyl-CoA reductase/sulfur reductase-like enzyme
MFSVPHYSKALNAIREEKGISGLFNHNLVEVRPEDKTAVFEVTAGEGKGKKVEKQFGMLHVTPPMGPLDWIKKSPLADAVGWVDVDQGTLQHKKYENVFSLGDASSLPTSKASRAEHHRLHFRFTPRFLLPLCVQMLIHLVDRRRYNRSNPSISPQPDITYGNW